MSDEYADQPDQHREHHQNNLERVRTMRRLAVTGRFGTVTRSDSRNIVR
jgi:uncharacterized protein YciI